MARDSSTPFTSVGTFNTSIHWGLPKITALFCLKPPWEVHVTCTDQQTMARIHTLVASLSVGIISKQCRNAPEVIRGILLSILT